MFPSPPLVQLSRQISLETKTKRVYAFCVSTFGRNVRRANDSANAFALIKATIVIAKPRLGVGGR